MRQHQAEYPGEMVLHYTPEADGFDHGLDRDGRCRCNPEASMILSKDKTDTRSVSVYIHHERVSP